MKNPILNILRSTLSKDPIFGIDMDILRTGKNPQLEPLGKKYSDLIEELAPKIINSSFLKRMFGLTQTTELISERMKYHNFYSLDNFRSSFSIFWRHFLPWPGISETD